MIKYLPVVVLIILSILVGYLLYDSREATTISKDLKARLDSIAKVNDSLLKANLIDSVIVEQIKIKDSLLTVQLLKQKDRIIIVDRWVDSSKAKVDSLTNNALVSSLNERYPADTVSNPLPVAKPVLTAAAKDLIELDGSKVKLEIKDSVITLQESKMLLKDSIITVQAAKEVRYKTILGNQEYTITEWKGQYNVVAAENKKLKQQTKFQKALNYVLAGGLIYLAASR